MLVDFRIKNFALIDELTISFQKGLTVLTGETGAGKSIIIGALEILLGARANSDLIRSGKENAYIEAAFEPEKIKQINTYLEEVGIEVEPSLVLLSREIRENGRNRNRINGQLATAGMIRAISKYLVDIHGQHEHQLLLDASSHLSLLDDYRGCKEDGLLEQVASLYQEISTVKEKISQIKIDESAKARKMDLLKFQIDEIEQAQLQAGEEERVYQEFKLMANLEEIHQTTGMIANLLTGNDYNNSGILGQLGVCMKKMDGLKDYDPQLKQFFTGLSDVYYQLEELGFSFHSYLEGLEFNQEKLDMLEKRISLINGLQRKYGKTIADILEYKTKMSEELAELEAQEKTIADLNKQLEQLNQHYYQYAQQLSQVRQEKARELEAVLARELKDLAMQDTIFTIAFEDKEASFDGIDRIEFLISTNAGEEVKPLAKIASGGELSRIMLALKTIIAHIDQVDTLIFDEVDSGVGGQTAQKMAEKLAIISRQRQVFCISHLPQIASMADCHYYISKIKEGNRTYTRINPLDQEGKRKELARMLGGVALTETTLEHAGEMLVMAETKKASL